MEFLESSITLSQSSRSEGVKIFLVVFIERLKEEKIPPSWLTDTITLPPFKKKNQTLLRVPPNFIRV